MFNSDIVKKENRSYQCGTVLYRYFIVYFFFFPNKEVSYNIGVAIYKDE